MHRTLIQSTYLIACGTFLRTENLSGTLRASQWVLDITWNKNFIEDGFVLKGNLLNSENLVNAAESGPLQQRSHKSDTCVRERATTDAHDYIFYLVHIYAVSECLPHGVGPNLENIAWLLNLLESGCLGYFQENRLTLHYDVNIGSLVGVWYLGTLNFDSDSLCFRPCGFNCIQEAFASVRDRHALDIVFLAKGCFECFGCLFLSKSAFELVNTNKDILACHFTQI